jgi:ADP-heptose:LPS heptosyltransferase
VNVSTPFRRVVVLRTDRIGDMLVSTPAMRNLREALPEAHLTLVTSTRSADVLKGWEAIDALEVIDPSLRGARTQLVERLRRAGPDLVFAFTPRSADYWLARSTGAPVRVGFGYRSRPLDFAFARLVLTHAVFSRVPEAVTRAHEVPHHAEELLALLSAVSLPAPKRPMEVPIAAADREWAERLVASRGTGTAPIALHLSHKWLNDGWGADDVTALVRALGDIDDSREVAITIGPEDRGVWESVRGALGSTVLVLDKPSFGRWAAFIGACALVVSPDTAAIHLASATRRPVVGVYATYRFHVFSRQWGPWMVPCRTVPKTRGPSGVRAIASAAASLLGEVAPPGLHA